MQSFPAWFPLYVIAAIVLVYLVRWRAPDKFWWAIGAVVVLTFVVSAAWTFFR